MSTLFHTALIIQIVQYANVLPSTWPSREWQEHLMQRRFFSGVPAESYFHRMLCMHFSDRLLQETGAQEGSKHDWNETCATVYWVKPTTMQAVEKAAFISQFCRTEITCSINLWNLCITLPQDSRNEILKRKHFILRRITHLGVYYLLTKNECAMLVHLHYSTNYTVSSEPPHIFDSLICYCTLFCII